MAPAKQQAPAPAPEAADWGTFGSLSDFAESFGEKLESIENVKVLVRSITIVPNVSVQDPQTGEDILKDVCIITIEHPQSAGHAEKVYTFSEPLIKSLLKAEPNLPLTGTFFRREFDNGKKRVWSIK